MNPPVGMPADWTEHDEHKKLEQRRVRREGTTMVLYLSIVLLGTLAAVPAGEVETGTIQGPTGRQLAAVIVGTTLGLALAHLFAFHIAAYGVALGPRSGQEFKEARAQLIGAALVATLACIPIVLLGPAGEQQAVLFVLAIIIGGADFSVERSKGRSRGRSATYGLVTFLIALVVAAVKVALGGH